MKKQLSVIFLILAVLLSTSSVIAFGQITTLSDIEGHWVSLHKEDLYLLQHLGILEGYQDGTFKPNNPITRAEFTKILVVALGEEVGIHRGNSSFYDVDSFHWAYHYIEKAVEKEILLPSDYNNQLQPNKPITRQEMAIMIVRGLKLSNEGFIETTVANTIFIDDDAIDNEAKPFIYEANQRGIITGYPTAKGLEFKPQQTATRAEAALMLVRFLDQKTELKKTGFYAIDSFKQLEVTKHFDEVVFGWSALVQKDTGEVTFTLNSKESLHRLPSGYDSALQFTDSNEIDRKLMLTDTRTDLIYKLLDSKESQAEVIELIVESLLEYGFTGIVMDLENIWDGDNGYKNAYTSFLKDLNTALKPHQLTLSVAVQPKNVVGFYDGYDYKAISQFADEIILMAHDYHDPKTTTYLTDQAPFPKVHEALNQLIDDGVEANKIILGLQMAGGTQIRKLEDGTRMFYTPPFNGIYRAIEERPGNLTFDYRTMTPQFYYIDEVNNHENWIRFENGASINAKLRLAKFYGIKGISVWRIGEIPAEILEVLQ